MVINSKESETSAVLMTADLMAGAVRTAPKTKGIDRLDTVILNHEDLDRLVKKMEQIGVERDLEFFRRDSRVLQEATAVLLVAVKAEPSGLNEICQYCGSKNCESALDEGKRCAFTSIDLGIAIGSALSISNNNYIDSRVMFSAGRAAREYGPFKKYDQVIAIALACKGKNPFFDRVEQFGTHF